MDKAGKMSSIVYLVTMTAFIVIILFVEMSTEKMIKMATIGLALGIVALWVKSD